MKESELVQRPVIGGAHDSVKQRLARGQRAHRPSITSLLGPELNIDRPVTSVQRA